MRSFLVFVLGLIVGLIGAGVLLFQFGPGLMLDGSRVAAKQKRLGGAV